MNGRVYDPRLGRFLQADPFIQFPNNTQSYNRYSYVLNNPLAYTDPSGYFLKKLLKNKIFRVVVAVVVAYVTYGAASEWSAAMLSTTTTSTASVTIGGAGTLAGGTAATASVATSVTTLSAAGAVASGAFAGASAGFVSGAILSGSLSGAAKGAFSGAVFGGIGGYFGNTWNASRVASNGVAGGISSEISGGKFSDGIKLSLLADLAAFGYQKYVGYRATLDPGGSAVVKGEFERPRAGANNFGTQGHKTIDSNGLVNEGGRVSRIANQYPGLNSVAGVHDMFQIRLGQISNSARNALNIPGMPIAAIWSYAALMNTPVLAGTMYGAADE